MENENVENENVENENVENDSTTQTLSVEAQQVVIETQRQQIEELKKDLERERAEHKADIISLMLGNQQQQSKEEIKMREMIDRINQSRRRH